MIGIDMVVVTVLICYRSDALETGAFHVAEEIKGFHSIRLTWFGPQIQLHTAMYILVNTAAD